MTDITQIMEIGSTKKESSECTGNTGYGYKGVVDSAKVCVSAPQSSKSVLMKMVKKIFDSLSRLCFKRIAPHDLVYMHVRFM